MDFLPEEIKKVEVFFIVSTNGGGIRKGYSLEHYNAFLYLLESGSVWKNPIEKGDFYMLYVLKRKKDQPEGERDNHQSVRTIKTYCIESLEHLDRRYEEVKMLCEVFKARAYIHVQKQNHKDISLEMLSTLATRIKDGAVNQKGLFDSVVGKIPGREKRWVVDIDNISAKYLLEVLNVIDTIKPVGDKVLKVLPTKNGWHAITSRFDTREFSERFPQIDVQKKNPTLLYYPDSLGINE